jgi:hypothetical protein
MTRKYFGSEKSSSWKELLGRLYNSNVVLEKISAGFFLFLINKGVKTSHPGRNFKVNLTIPNFKINLIGISFPFHITKVQRQLIRDGICR